MFCQSIIDNASQPVTFTPLIHNVIGELAGACSDGSNKFIYTRFLTPYIQNFNGWSIFCDGDMVCRSDIAELWDRKNPKYAVMVAKHNYKTKASTKYLGNQNEDYPRKNWSSVIVWNNQHPSNQRLTPDFIQSKNGAFLHRFEWLEDDEIGDLPLSWNWLAEEYEPNQNADLVHYTLGTPCFQNYKNCELSELWHKSYQRHNEGMNT